MKLQVTFNSGAVTIYFKKFQRVKLHCYFKPNFPFKYNTSKIFKAKQQFCVQFPTISVQF